MQIGFINFSGLKYDTNTPYKKPLGGSESTMCYLSEELAKNGQQVTLFTGVNRKATVRGVKCLPLNKLSEDTLKALDVLVVQNSPLQGFQIKPLLRPATKLVLWIGHAHDQPAVQPMYKKEICNAYDAFVFVSQWQRNCYAEVFPIPRNKMLILRNAISPVFENFFGTKGNILSLKTVSPILAYTTTPFRGLNFLIRIFPQIRKLVPGTTLKIFSSLKVYQIPDKEDKKNYGKLYRLCQKTPGVKYVGSVSQSKLAEELKKISIFAYPNTFPETSCISAMEAMAAGCQIVTSDLAALPETTAGFADLISARTDMETYLEKFIKKIVVLLDNNIKKQKPLEKKLRKQVNFVNKNYTWKVRAGEWIKFFKKIIR
jgi:glycosyltransferase involved in cell wall biosynthesis